MKLRKALRVLVTVAAVALLAVHAIWPDLAIDVVTIILLLVALLPWLPGHVESIELPGGLKVNLRQVEEAGKKVAKAQPALRGEPDDFKVIGQAAYLSVLDSDPNLALVGLRIEIEHRLRALAEFHGVESRLPLGALFRELRQRGVLEAEAAAGLEDLIVAGNKAAHGAQVDVAVARWTTDVAPAMLDSLEVIVRRSRP